MTILFDASVPSAPAPPLALWYRPTPRQPWRAVAMAATSAELTARMDALPSGDFLTLPAGEDPNRRNDRHRIRAHRPPVDTPALGEGVG